MRLAFAIFMMPAAALADCPGGAQIFACDMGGKAVEVCLTGNSVSYAYGPPGKPELNLSVPVVEAGYTPWNGIGRAIWESIAFRNNGVTYEVWSAVDRLTEEREITGGINISDNGAEIAALACTPRTVRPGLDALYAAKEAAGQCYDRSARRWATACPEN